MSESCSMRFEIEVSIPDGYEATGEYRLPNAGELYLLCPGHAGKASYDRPGEPRLILREKPLAYEDFEPRSRVSVKSAGVISLGGNSWYAREARGIAAALIAAADHVDRVNAQKERS